MDFTIQKGIKLEHIEDAARLYADAFQTKFAKILGRHEDIVRLISRGLNRQTAFSATSRDNELLGIVGFHFNNVSFININLKHLINHYGLLSGLIKFSILAIIFYRKHDAKNQLLMDRIAVKEGNRRKGIGKHLFKELEQFARDNTLSSIKLDVINENPNAKRLYEKIGFVPNNYKKVPEYIFRIIGVSGSTTMIKKLLN